MENIQDLRPIYLYLIPPKTFQKQLKNAFQTSKNHHRLPSLAMSAVAPQVPLAAPEAAPEAPVQHATMAAMARARAEAEAEAEAESTPQGPGPTFFSPAIRGVEVAKAIWRFLILG